MSGSRLDSASLFAAEIPRGSEQALECIRKLQGAAGAEEAQATYAGLLRALAPLESSEPSADLPDDQELGRRWTEAVLLWMQFCKTSSVPLIDSLGDATLRSYPVDLPPDESAFARLRQALCASTGQGAAEFADAERAVQHLASALPLKVAIASALQKKIEGQGGANSATLPALMQRFYGALPWRAGDVDFVLTSTAAFFVLPHDGDRFEVADWQERPEPERQLISDFLQRLGRANKTETWRFPAFGLFDPAALDPDLVGELAVACSVRPELVQKTLCTMVSVLPKDEVAQYLVHDAWGHTWQEVLSEFEWEYALVREIAKPLVPGDGPKFGGESVSELGAAFVSSGGTTVLDENKLLTSVDADLRGRIQAGLSVALSELFADLVEAKHSRLNPDAALPTSSLLAQHTLKFDLTISDTLRQARRWARPYRELTTPEHQQRFAGELAARGLPTAGLADAVAQMSRAIEHHFAAALVAEVGTTRSTVAGRALLQLALLARELERVLDESGTLRPSPAWTRPSVCPDLWAVGLSHFYEADRPRRFWCLDRLLRGPLRGLADALGHELAAAR
jgi:hypothetical protein